MRVALIAVVAGLLAGCDEDIFLSGKWIPSGLTGGEGSQARALGKWLSRCPADASDDSCEVFFEVSMGHYGEDVVGVLRFFENESRQREAECRPAEGLFCSCTSIQGVYRGSQMDFELRDCANTVHDAVMRRIDSETVQLELLPTAGCDPDRGNCQPFQLTLTKVLSEDQLTVRDKACAECVAE